MARAPDYPGMPSWVKISGIVVALVLLLVIALLMAGGGRHGPNRHISSDAAGDRTWAFRVAEAGGRAPPVGGY